MKRILPLVSYESSDDECAAETVPKPPLKRRYPYSHFRPGDFELNYSLRKLPVLPSAFNNAGPVDNPSLHQGRVRTTPHIEGQWAAYVFVPLKLEPKSALSKVLSSVVVRAKESVPILRPIAVYTQDGDTQDHELHISLTRPVYLRSHQREDFKRAVKTVAKTHSPYVPNFLCPCISGFHLVSQVDSYGTPSKGSMPPLQLSQNSKTMREQGPF